MSLEDAMADYFDTFGDNYPLMCRMGVPEEQMVEEIYRCIDEGRPAEYEEGVEY